MMEEPEHPESESPEPVRPQFLEYRGSVMHPDRPRMTGGQIAAGFGCWVGSVAVGGGLGVVTGSVGFGAVSFIAVVVLACCSIPRRVGRRGFVPGLLIGIGFTCLVPVGILAALCWSK